MENLRKILFRGKTLSGKWVYGYYVVKAEKHIIYSRDDIQSYFVIPETVGQFTGLHDKDGKEIYEGDVLSDEFKNLAIKFMGGSFGTWDGESFTTYSTSWRVIGNIHDNPELLEENK